MVKKSFKKAFTKEEKAYIQNNGGVLYILNIKNNKSVYNINEKLLK